jgi:hypothetical protein
VGVLDQRDHAHHRDGLPDGDLAFLVYIYVGWLPPLEAAWLRERRRAKYLPKPKRRRR